MKTAVQAIRTNETAFYKDVDGCIAIEMFVSYTCIYSTSEAKN